MTHDEVIEVQAPINQWTRSAYGYRRRGSWQGQRGADALHTAMVQGLGGKEAAQILPDYDAVRILKEMGETKPPTVFYNMECACLVGAIRQV